MLPRISNSCDVTGDTFFCEKDPKCLEKLQVPQGIEFHNNVAVGRGECYPKGMEKLRQLREGVKRCIPKTCRNKGMMPIKSAGKSPLSCGCYFLLLILLQQAPNNANSALASLCSPLLSFHLILFLV